MAQNPRDTFARGKNVTRPQATSVESDTITLSWFISEDSLPENCCFDIYYKEHNKGRFVPYITDKPWKDDSILITKLKAETSYVFKVKIISEDTDEEGPFSPTSAVITTTALESEKVPEGSLLIGTSPIKIYRLHVEEDMKARNEEKRIRRLTLGQPSPKHRERTILLVGATGSGKSTLVNAMANYIYTVQWDDPFRLVLINRENDEQHHTEAVSQTSWVTCYKIYTDSKSPLNYNINIIDTPGFGHTGGIEHDTNILSQLKELFQSPDRYEASCINAVCMVVKAPDARLTQSQQYIFKSVLSLFGKDIIGNMCTIVTFADGEKPPVIAALAALEDTPLPYKVCFPVNNSALYVDNGGPVSMSSICWKLGNESYEKFFDSLEKLQTQSLCLTVNVLSLRDAVDNTIQNLKDVLDVTVGKIANLEYEMHEFEKHKDEIERNKDFIYTVSVIERKKVEFSRFRRMFRNNSNTTTCTVCEFTCHLHCSIKENEEKVKCDVIDKEGNCTECPQRCRWMVHANNPWLYKKVTRKEQRTYKEKQHAFENAVKKKVTLNEMLEQMKLDILEEKNKMDFCMHLIKHHIEQLEKNALLKNPPSATEYIDWLIKEEKRTKSVGFENRIEALTECREKKTYEETLNAVTFKLKHIGVD